MAGALRFTLALIATCAGGCEAVVPLEPDAGVDGGAPFFQVVVEGPPDAGSVSWFAVHGSSADNVVMVGAGGAVARWNGTALNLEQSGTTEDLRGVFVVDKDTAWAVGANGTVTRYLDQMWSVQTTGTTAYLNAVWSDGAAHMVTVGAQGAAFAFDTTFHVVATDSPDDLFAIANPKSGLFAVGTLGTIASYDGTSFHRTALAGYSDTLTGAATGAGGTWVVGVGGAVYRTDGMLTQIMGVPSLFVRGVAAPGADVWVVGFDALVARVNGGKVEVYTDVPDRWYEAVWAASDLDVWVVGNAGVVLHSNPAALGDGGVGAPTDGSAGGAG